MADGVDAERLMWRRLALFARRAEYILCSGASLDDAEEILFGWEPPGGLPVCFACLTGCMVDTTAKG